MLYKPLEKSDIPIIVDAFAKASWPKLAEMFERYLEEQKAGERLVWAAFDENKVAGYITLKWCSQYEPFANSAIPEIMDLNVLPSFRNKGIASKLLDIAENEAAKKSDFIGIGVGLYNDYGSAQRIYVKRGYIPDGKGVTYNYKSTIPGKEYPLDDDLVLWFTKRLQIYEQD